MILHFFHTRNVLKFSLPFHPYRHSLQTMGSQVSVDNVHVVVVGGGFGGTAAAQQLKSRGIPFTLIDLRDAFHHNVAALRAAVQSGENL